jgi:integrase
MASVIRYEKSRYWVAAFRDASGKQHRRTTRETSRKRALAVAEQFERVAKRQASAARVRKTFSEFYREHYGEDLEQQSSVRSYVQQFLDSRKNETSARSRAVYRLSLEKFLAFLGARADQPLDEVTRQQVAAFRDAQLACSAAATTNLTLKVVKMLFRSARRDGVVFEDVAESVNTVKASATFERRPFTIDEVRRIIDVANDEWRSLILFGLYTGQRLGDIAALTWSQVDLERDEIRLTARKTGKPLIVPIAPALKDHLLEIVADDPHAPVHPRAFKNVTANDGIVADLSNQFGELLVSAGLRETSGGKGVGRSGRRQGQELSFHSLRHTAVSLMKDAGVPDAVVMALVGHDSRAMSAHYTHVGKEALAKAARSLPEILSRSSSR